MKGDQFGVGRKHPTIYFYLLRY